MKKTNIFTILLVALIIIFSIIFPQFIVKSGKVVSINLDEFSDKVSSMAQKYENISKENEIVFTKENVVSLGEEFFVKTEEFSGKTNLNVEYGLDNKLILTKRAELLSFFEEYEKIEIDLSQNLAFETINQIEKDSQLLNFTEQDIDYVPLKCVSEKIGLEIKSNSGDVVLSSPFASGRLIITSNSSFEHYGAIDVISGFKDYYILQYSSSSDAQSAFEKLLKKEEITSIQPDVKVYASGAIQEVYESNESAELLASKSFKSWGVEAMGVDDYINHLNIVASEQSLNEVVVAVIDTGIDSDHEMLASRIESGGKSFVASETTIDDLNGHGTHVSGTVVDTTLSNVKILPLKVLDRTGKGYASYTISAIEYCISLKKTSLQNLKVMNMSLGVYSTYAQTKNAMTSAVNDALDEGILTVCASGNESINTTNNYPASVDSAITVSSVGQSNGTFYRASYSNYGTHVDFCAPGDAILSAYLDNRYVNMSGTSMASPHVAGVYALMLSDPIHNYSFTEITNLLIQNAKDLGSEGKDAYFGNGLIILDNVNVGKCADVTFSVIEENFDNEFNLELNCADSNAVIYYTTDATNPSLSNGVKYQNSILISETITIKAIAYVLNSSGKIVKVSGITSKTYYHKLVEKDANFVVDENGELTEYLGNMTRFKVPEIVNGKTVVSVGKGAFQNNTNIEAIYLPSSCTTIKENAFYGCVKLGIVSGQGVQEIEFQGLSYTALEELTDENFPALKEIGRYSFYGTNKLEKIALKNVENLGAYCFATNVNNTSLVNVDLENVKELSIGAFSGRIGLKSINCPHVEIIRSIALKNTAVEKVEFPSVKIVGANSFENCEQLASVLLPEVVDVGSFAFSNCVELVNVNFPKMQKLGTSAFLNCSNLETFGSEKLQIALNYVFQNCKKLHTIKASKIKKIGVGCFAECEKIKSVSFPSVIEIPEKAFYGCSALNNIEISPAVQRIGENAFSGVGRYFTIITSSLNAEIQKILDQNPNFSVMVNSIIGNVEFKYTFNFSKSGVTINGLMADYAGEELIIPAMIDDVPVVKIGANAFKDNKKIKQINLPQVIEIAEGAFENCVNLNCLYVPNVRKIEANAFKNCTNLEIIDIYSVQVLGDEAFFNCEKLLKLELGENVQSIGEKAIGFVIKSDEIVVNPLFTLIACEDVARSYAQDNDITINFRYETENYRIYYSYAGLVNIYVQIAEVVEIKHEEEIAIPQKIGSYDVKVIGSEAFIGTTFKRVKLPSAVVEISHRAFAFCENLVEIEMPNVKSVSSQAFYCCSKLKNIHAPNLLFVESNAFGYCTSLEEFSAINIKTIQERAFFSCVNLNSIMLPNLTQLGYSVFADSGIKTIYLGNKLQQANDNTSLNRENFNATIFSYQGSTSETFANLQKINFVAIDDFEFKEQPSNVLNAISGVEIALSANVGGVLDELDLYVGSQSNKSDSVLFAKSKKRQMQVVINESGKKYAYFVARDWLGNEITSNVFEINLLKPSTLFVTKIGNGVLNLEGYKELDAGQGFKLNVGQVEGYFLKDILINHQSIGEVRVKNVLTSGLIFSNVISPQNVQVIFDIQKYEIVATAGSGGTIEKAGVGEYEHGANATYSFTANKGYEVESIKVDGTDLVGEDLIKAIQNGYTFENIKTNRTIDVKFKMIQYQVNICAGENGSFEIDGNLIKTYGENIEVLIYPNVGYVVKSVNINGEDKTNLLANNVLSLVQEDVELNIDIEFEKKVLGITVKINGNGTYALDGDKFVKYGESSILYVLPKSGNKFYEIKVNGKIVQLNDENEIEFNNITENLIIELTFKTEFEIFLINLFKNPVPLLIAGGAIILIIIIVIIIVKKKKNKENN